MFRVPAQPGAEVRGVLLEVLQDRLQGDALQLHAQAVPYPAHQGQAVLIPDGGRGRIYILVESGFVFFEIMDPV